MKQKFQEAITKLRQEDKKNFVQSFDLIVNLTEIDLRKEPVTAFFSFPHAFKENKICGFLESKNDLVDRTITKAELTSIDKKQIKNISKDYDFFISAASLMPSVASIFGKILGPLGKMPNPKIGGVVMKEDGSIIKGTVDKFRKSVSLKAKELSFKVSIGKESMKDEEIIENLDSAFNAIMNSLPRKKDNIRSVMVKLTMSKPIRVGVK
ncbi:MAG: hypothetical protein KKE23_03750 [Nanoarchaeota archaeon]|nr:hypothetical protein [Nanoarchaeota archaeon]